MGAHCDHCGDVGTSQSLTVMCLVPNKFLPFTSQKAHPRIEEHSRFGERCCKILGAGNAPL